MWVLLLLALPALAGGNMGYGAGVDTAAMDGNAASPMFAARQPRVVTAADGGVATLVCRVLNIGVKTVSWVRSRDLVILSHAGQVFTSDSRVSTNADAGAGTGAHVLRIERLRPSDSGRYECQLNTEPKMSLFFELVVVDTLEEPEVMQHDESAAAEVHPAEPAPRVTSRGHSCLSGQLLPMIIPLLFYFT